VTTVREQLMAGRDAFERGEFFEAHEHWEAAWNASDGIERRWLQGMIQIATALHKLAGGRADLARAQLTKALAKLADAPPPSVGLEGLDLARFAADAAALLAALMRDDTRTPRTLHLHAIPGAPR
jgi:predicted metal-dependent hydrolase